VVALKREEWDELNDAEKREHMIAEAKNVFGHDAKKDPRTGKYIEQGFGSASQPTEQHFQALAVAEGQEVADKARAEAMKRGTFPPKRNEAF
jgi:hypothetical protein